MPKNKVDGGGKRFNEGKSRVDLIPADALMAIGEGFGYGAKKYYDEELPRPEQNWLRGQRVSTVIGSMLRHLYRYMMGQDKDEESGLPHLTHLCVNAIFLLTYHLRGIDKADGIDDIRLDLTENK